MEIFKAEVITPFHQGPQDLHNAALYKGKLVEVIQDYTKENPTVAFCPVYNHYSINLDGKKQEVTNFHKELNGKWASPDLDKYLSFMLHMGDNGNGYFVTNIDEETEKFRIGKINRKECHICYSILGFYQLESVLPQDVWLKIKPFGEYQDLELDSFFVDDVENVDLNKETITNWYFAVGIVDVLIGLGWKIFVNNLSIQSSQELREHQNLEERKFREDQTISVHEINKYFAKGNRLAKHLEKFKKVKLSALEALYVETLPHIYFRKLDWKGERLNGDGKWMAKDDDFLYRIYNKGRFSNDWSKNNISTSWAGAIGYKTPLNDEVKDLLLNCEKYEYAEV